MEEVLQPQLISLVYVSSATEMLNDQQLTEILRKARRNNEQNDITGMLLYREGSFMQVLEGTEPAISTLMKKLTGDQSHKAIIVLFKKQISQRQFGNWSMAFRNLSDIPETEMANFSPFLKDSFLDQKFQLAPERSYKLLLSFKTNCR